MAKGKIASETDIESNTKIVTEAYIAGYAALFTT